jgi:glycosyltransferase involved in cell wall biosynthesis
MRYRILIFLPSPEVWMGGFNYYLRLANNIVEMYPSTHFYFVSKTDSAALKDAISLIEDKNSASFIFNPKIKFIKKLKSFFQGKSAIIEYFRDKYDINLVFESGSFYGCCKEYEDLIISWIPDLQHIFLPKNFNFFKRARRTIGFYLQKKFRKKLYFSSHDAEKSFSDIFGKATHSYYVVRFDAASKKDIDTKKEISHEILKKFKINKPYLFFPGQLWVHKNHLFLFETLDYLNKNGLVLPYLIVLSGINNDQRNPEYSKSIENYLSKPEIKEMLIYTGQIPYHQVQNLFENSIGLLNCSLFEGWSTIVEEAKIYNKPLILSDIKIHREQSNNNAIFFDPHSISDFSKVLLNIDVDVFNCCVDYPESTFKVDLKNLLE